MVSVGIKMFSSLCKAFGCKSLDLLIRQKFMVSVRTLLFSYLRKAFDCLSLDLLLHKTKVYGFSKNFNIFVPLQAV